MFLSITAFFAYLIVQLSKAPDFIASRVDPVIERVKQRDEQIKSILKNTNDLVEENYWDTKANVETTAVILRDVSEITRTLRQQLLPELVETVKGFRSMIKEIEYDVQVLSASGNETIKATADLVRQLDSLTAELEVQVKQGSPKVLQTVESIDKVLVDIDKHINNPDLYAITNNVKDITGNTAEITKTVDITTRPLREKVKLIKIVLLRIMGMIRIQPF
jgi:vacuolar-type H+-ATPase subunit I/STV1